MSKARSFCFTDFTLNKDFYLKLTDYKYIIVGLETCPTTKKEHFQGYIQFENPRSIKAIRELFEPRHIEICKGTPWQNYTYCTKDNNLILESGNRPKQGKRSDLEEIKEDIKQGMDESYIAENYFSQWIRYNKSFEKYRDIIQEDRRWKTEVIVYWGEPGSGKTRKAIEEGGIPIQYRNGFWLGYNNQPVIIIDDFDSDSLPIDEFLKITDRYPYNINIKNGSKKWNPNKIIITSNFDPENWYRRCTKQYKAVQRRIDKVVHMERNGSV